jgi:hypothetical protein
MDVEVGHIHHAVRGPQAIPLLPRNRVGLTQARHGKLEQPIHLPAGDSEPRPVGRDADDRVQNMPADEDRKRRQPAEHDDVSTVESDFLVRLAHGGILDSFAWVEPAARKRDLPRVMPQIERAYCERYVPRKLDRIHQQQRSRGPQTARIDDGLPPASKARRHALL